MTSDEWLERLHRAGFGITVNMWAEHDEVAVLLWRDGKPCIRLWSNAGETVLSPFAGIGSEGYEAVRLGRRYIGIELKPSYFRQAVKNLQTAEATKVMPTLFDVTVDNEKPAD